MCVRARISGIILTYRLISGIVNVNSYTSAFPAMTVARMWVLFLLYKR